MTDREQRRDLGERLAAFRTAANLTQQQLADATTYSRSRIAAFETGRALPAERFWREADRLTAAGGRLLAAYAEHQTATHAAAMAEAQAKAGTYRSGDTALTDFAHTSVTFPTADTEGDTADVKRAEFLAGVAATVAAPGIVFAETTRIGADDLPRYRESLEQLYALDDTFGGSTEVYLLTVRTLRKLRHDFNRASYTPAVGQQLRSIAGQLAEHAGWLAFDAGDSARARHWWLEALHAARIADAGDDVEVVVLASMSASASRQGQGRDAVDLAAAAQRVATAKASPRLVSLLSAREALGHARLGDAHSAAKALTRAHAKLTDHTGDDPAWSEFWDPADLAGHETVAARHLRDLDRAEQTARDAVALVDGRRYPRNKAMNVARLAGVLAQRGDLDEAVPMTAHATLAARELHSQRLVSEVSTALDALALHDTHAGARELVAHARPALPERSWARP